MKRWKDLDPEGKQFTFVVGVLLGGFHLVLLGFWLIGGDTGAGGALLFIDGTIAVVCGVIWLSTKIFPSRP